MRMGKKGESWWKVRYTVCLESVVIVRCMSWFRLCRVASEGNVNVQVRVDGVDSTDLAWGSDLCMGGYGWRRLKCSPKLRRTLAKGRE